MRVAQVVELRPEHRQEYIELHAKVWPDVLAALKAAHVSNYSIYLHGNLIFAYLEYDGDDYEADMARVAEDEATQRWWKITDPMQRSLRTSETEGWWVRLPEVFHLD